MARILLHPPAMDRSYPLSGRRALPAGRREPEHPDLGRSVERVVDHARGMLHDQAQLWRLEATETAQHAARGAAGLVAGAAFGALTWVVLMMALYELLLTWLVPEVALLLVAMLNGAIALTALLVGRRELQRTGRAGGDGAS